MSTAKLKYNFSFGLEFELVLPPELHAIFSEAALKMYEVFKAREVPQSLVRFYTRDFPFLGVLYGCRISRISESLRNKFGEIFENHQPIMQAVIELLEYTATRGGIKFPAKPYKQIKDKSLKKWLFEIDTCLDDRCRFGFELITPLLTENDVYYHVPNIILKLKKIGLAASRECTFHLHLSTPQMSDGQNIGRLSEIKDKLAEMGFSDFAIAVFLMCQNFAVFEKFGRAPCCASLKDYIYNTFSAVEIEDIGISKLKRKFSMDKSAMDFKGPSHITAKLLNEILIYRNSVENDFKDYILEKSSVFLNYIFNKGHNAPIKFLDNNIEIRSFCGQAAYDQLASTAGVKKFLRDAVSQIPYMIEFKPASISRQNVEMLSRNYIKSVIIEFYKLKLKEAELI